MTQYMENFRMCLFLPYLQTFYDIIHVEKTRKTIFYVEASHIS